MAILILDKEFHTSPKRNKENYHVQRRTLHKERTEQDDIIILSEAKTNSTKRENKFTIIIGDFNIPLSVINRIVRKNQLVHRKTAKWYSHSREWFGSFFQR